MSRDGFTLLEILVATAILAAALAVLLPAMGVTERHKRLAETRETALLVAASTLAALEADPLHLARQGTESGLRWTASVAPDGERVGEVSAYRASVSVFPSPGEAAVTLDTELLVPFVPGQR